MSDYGVANLSTVLDMVKVVAFALQEGKIAVHCHAGLGRTGNCWFSVCCGRQVSPPSHSPLPPM